MYRAKAAEFLTVLNKGNSLLQEKYVPRKNTLKTSNLKTSVLGFNEQCTSEYREKFIEWPLQANVQASHPPDALEMRWGKDIPDFETECKKMLKNTDIHVLHDATAGLASCRVEPSPSYFAWHPRNEFAEHGTHGLLYQFMNNSSIHFC